MGRNSSWDQAASQYEQIFDWAMVSAAPSSPTTNPTVGCQGQGCDPACGCETAQPERPVAMSSEFNMCFSSAAPTACLLPLKSFQLGASPGSWYLMNRTLHGFCLTCTPQQVQCGRSCHASLRDRWLGLVSNGACPSDAEACNALRRSLMSRSASDARKALQKILTTHTCRPCRANLGAHGEPRHKTAYEAGQSCRRKGGQ